MTPRYSYAIGTSMATITNLESLTTTPVRPPKSTFRPYSDTKMLGSGLVRGVGWPVATWQWNVITRAERDKLRAFCTGQSAEVYIRTKTLDTADSYKYYKCTMVWPTQNEERDAAHRVNLTIEFRALVLEADPA